MSVPGRVRDLLKRRPAAGSPLADRNFRLLTAGQATSTIGDFCYVVALPWFVLSSHGGTVLLGTVLACYGVPRTALIPLGGVLADRIGPRRLMLGADVARCLLAVALTVLAARHLATLAWLAPVAALLGAGEGLFMPASFAIMPTLLPAGSLQAGNAINSAAVQVGTVLGPALGGTLVATSGPVPAFAIDAASFAVSAGALWLMRPPPAVAAAPAEATAAAEAALAGQAAAAPAAAVAPGAAAGEEAARPSVWRLLLRSVFFRRVLLISVLANLTFAGTFEVALPALAHEHYGAGGFGTLMACLGVGAVAGTLVAARRLTSARPMVVASASFIAAGVFVALMPFLGGLPGAAIAALLFGAGIGFGDIIVITLIQQWSPAAMLGRVMSLLMLASLGIFPVSVAISGLLVRALGPVPFFPAAGATLILGLIIALASSEVRNFRPVTAPPEPAAASPAPAPSAR
ncbi:MAG TPA: MFS transporter [Streptosporangiaceae bacterium]|nr:MFS transporter [Streptosporangiaceae bacterium]